MSAKQLLKAEQLLDLITSPKSQTKEEEMMEGALAETACTCDQETKHENSDVLVDQSADRGATSCDSDVIACHLFLTETDSNFNAFDTNKQADYSDIRCVADASQEEMKIDDLKSELKEESSSQCDDDIRLNSDSAESQDKHIEVELKTKCDGSIKTDFSISEAETETSSAGLDTLLHGNENRKTVDLFDLEHRQKISETNCLPDSDINSSISDSETKHEGLELNPKNSDIETNIEEYQSDNVGTNLHVGMEIEPHSIILETSQEVKKTSINYTDTNIDSYESEVKDWTEDMGENIAREDANSGFSSQNLIEQEVSLPGSGQEDLKLELKACKAELMSMRKQLAKAERQLEKANSYNEDLRKQVETLSAEVHSYRHKTMVDADIQVDKDDLINYASGMMVLPDWGVQGSTDVGDTKADDTSDQAGSTEKLSIAESLKATAEAVVMEQSGFVYDQNSGLYYDYNTGYYYDNEKSLYYDPNSGTYFYYNHETNEYQFHSQVDVTCYQWQHQLGTSSSQNGGSGEATQAKQTAAGKGHPISNQQQIVSKEKLTKSEKRKKKEKKKEKEKDENIYKNRKERRKALREKIEHKRHKKKDKKHLKHKKKKKKQKKQKENEKEKTERYVEDKMRRRVKKKREEHKKDKAKICDEVIEIKEDGCMHWENNNTGAVNIDDKTFYESGDKRLKIEIYESKVVPNHTGTDTDIKCDVMSVIKSNLAIEGDTGAKKDPFIDEQNENINCELKNEDSMECSDSEIAKKSCSSTQDTLEKNSCGDSIETKEVCETTTDSNLKAKDIDSEVVKISEQPCDQNMLDDDNIHNLNLVLMDNADKTSENNGEEKMNKIEVENDIIDLEVIESGVMSIEETDTSKSIRDDSIVISSDSESEMESGEISESESIQSETSSFSDHSTDSSYDSDSSSSYVEEEEFSRSCELAGGWPPCIRVMVTESNCLEVGTLFIVTCTGGTVGREKDMNHTIRIPDINVSKMHAEVQYDSHRGQYQILDRGSQNGTYINDLRIPEGTSTAYPINHGDVLQLADTKLLCHIHSGSDTCDDCEPGIVKAKYFAKQPQKKITILSKEEKKQQQKQQLKEIKKKYGLKNAAYIDNAKVINNPQYTDKASERRKTVGIDESGFKSQETPASVHRPISSENIGHKLLKKMGWSEGESLGKENSGIQEPVTVTLRANQTAGLGSSTASFSPDDANSLDVRKAARRIQAQQRFDKVQTGKTGNQTNKPNVNKLWTKGETQYADGGNG